jgi:hypothetical protein
VDAWTLKTIISSEATNYYTVKNGYNKHIWDLEKVEREDLADSNQRREFTKHHA